MVRPVLEAGRHVLCEKPIAVDVESARALREMARQTSAVAMMGFTNRYTLAVRRACELLREGVLGEVALLSMEMHWGGGGALGWRHDGNVSPGGIWFDGGPHMIDTVGVLLGDLTVTGLATSTVRRDDGTRPTNPDVAAVSGVVGQGLGWGQLLPPPGVGRAVPVTGLLSRIDVVASDQVRIVGSDGALAFSLGRGQVEWLDIWANGDRQWRALEFQDDGVPGGAPPAIRRMVEAWAGAITTGGLSEWDANFEIGCAVQERLASVWPGDSTL
jgi:predicted dehydrogenase